MESLFIKVASLHLSADKIIKKRLRHRCFLANIAKFLRTPILKNLCKQLLLNMRNSRKVRVYLVAYILIYQGKH